LVLLPVRDIAGALPIVVGMSYVLAAGVVVFTTAKVQTHNCDMSLSIVKLVVSTHLG